MNDESVLMKELTELVPNEQNKPAQDLDMFMVSCTKTTFVPSCCADTAIQLAMGWDSWDTVDWHTELMLGEQDNA